jgi:hypothetical protein
MELQKHVHEKLDDLQRLMATMPKVDCPVKHTFLDYKYVRQIFMPALTKGDNGEDLQTIVISKIHKTKHPFVIVKGRVAVYNAQDQFLGILEAPYCGVTMPGTRRVLHILEDTVWLTIHRDPTSKAGDNQLPDEEKEQLAKVIEDIIIEKHDVSLEITNQKEVLTCLS